MQSKNSVWIIALVVTILLACCCIMIACAVLGFGLFAVNSNSSDIPGLPEITLIPPFEPDVKETPVTFPTPIPTNTSGSVDLSEAELTMQMLQEAKIGPNDPSDLAQRLKGTGPIPETVDTAPNYDPGDQLDFWATNTDTNVTRKITARLAYETDHTYIWVEEGVRTNADDVRKVAETFENHIYPTNRTFFGSEWSPGIDNDPHLYIVYTTGLGYRIVGYFSSSDEVHPLAHPYSNAHESFFLNADTMELDEEAYSTLAHEFQHMIHYHTDANESSWINEGFAVLAELLNGYDTGGFDYLYTSQPDQSLNDWPNDPNATTPYYGSAFLYLTYFLDRFGEDATKALVAESKNSLESVDQVLLDLQISDAAGKQLTADDVFADWVVTNYVQDERIGDGRYHYGNYANAPSTRDTEEVSTCSENWINRSVNQYGVDYIRLSCAGTVTLNLEGTQEVGVVPVDAYSGNYAFWSNKGDDSDIWLERRFDLRQVNGPLELTYRTWYDIEEDYDYLYLVASTDGTRWQILETPDCTEDNPAGNSYGCGYSGKSAGWIEQTVDLSQFAGQEVLLRFEYVTDGAVNGEGLLLDDVRVDALNYFTDFETDNGGWEGAGFVRLQNRLPQTYRISIIREGNQTTVESFTLNPGENLSAVLDFDGDLEDAVLVVSGTTRFTRQPAIYRFNLVP